MGGAFTANDAIIPGLVLGGVRFPITRVSVGQFRFGPGLAADGLLGSDILLAFDLDIDVPGKTLTLYRPACARMSGRPGMSRLSMCPV